MERERVPFQQLLTFPNLVRLFRLASQRSINPTITVFFSFFFNRMFINCKRAEKKPCTTPAIEELNIVAIEQSTGGGEGEGVHAETKTSCWLRDRHGRPLPLEY